MVRDDPTGPTEPALEDTEPFDDEEPGPFDTPGHLGRYRIERAIGAGGMGVVLRAHDPELDRAVAVKLLRRGDGTGQDRLLAEAQAMAKLRHANVVAVFDVGVAGGRVFVAMELVVGETLRSWLRAAPRPWRAIVTRFVAAGRGLAAAHAAGLVHRDFKADNVLCGDDGAIRVADFGLAGAGGEAGPIAGTPAYMAPEQHAGEAIGPAADQYAFAASLWEALAGARPFAGDDAAALHAAKRAGQLAAPRGDAPRRVFGLLRRALAAAPADRHRSIAALVDALEHHLGRRRRIAIAAAALAAIAGSATAAIALTRPAPAARCELAAADVARAWSPAARAQVIAAFAATTRPHAAATAERVTAALDRHAAALADARATACLAADRAAQSVDARDRRAACLDQRLASTSALIELLAHADDAIVDRAYEAVALLPAPGDCTTTVAPAPPPAVRAQVDAAVARFAAADALRAAGKLPEARAAFDALVAEVRLLGHAPLLAEVAAGRARTLAELGDAEAGGPAFQEAAEAAAAARDDRLIAVAWLGQLSLLGDEGGEPGAAAGRLGFAEVAVERAADPALREELLYVKSDIARGTGDLDAARADLEAALASLTARGAQHTLAMARVQQQLYRVVFDLGDNDRALDLARTVLAAYEELLGPEHPTVAKALNNLGNSLDEASRYVEAEAVHLRALAIKERVLGPDDPSVATTLHNLGTVTSNLGRLDDSIAYTARAIAIREARLGPDHPLLASSIANQAANLELAGRHAEALAMHERALAIRTRVNGPDHPALIHGLVGMTTTLLSLRRPDDALVSARRAVAIAQAKLDPSADQLGIALNALADVYQALGQPALDCATRARAVAVVEKARGPRDGSLIDPLKGHAECLLAAGHRAAARAAAERVIAIVEDTHLAPYYAARAHVVIARALWDDPKTRDEARAVTARARALYDASPGGGGDEKAAFDAWAAAHR